MQKFYQGSMRCKDFLPFVVNTLATHGWKIVDSSGDGYWAVIQKVATTGGIMTFFVKEAWFPNFGHLSINGLMAITDVVDENGVFVDAYDPTTKTLKRACYNRDYMRTADQSATSWTGYPTAQYYTGAKSDADDSPTHVFYILSVTDDGFFIKARGNPAVSGNTYNVFYGGAFNKLVNEIDTNNPRGLWGEYGSYWYGKMCSICADGTRPLDTVGWQSYSITSHLDAGGAQDATNIPTLGFDNGYLVSQPYLASNADPVISIPMPIAPRGADLVDENYFLEFDGDKYVYLTATNVTPSNLTSILAKVISGVKDLQVKDNGAGYEITWLNPNDSAIDKIKLYAKTTGMPASHDDPDAVLVHTVNTVSINDIVTYIDTDASRYGQTVYYAAFTFDSGLPTPNVSMLSPQGSAKIGNIIASLPSHATIHNPTNVAYEFSNKNKINAFYSATAAFPCNDNAGTTVVTDIVNGLHGTASGNTSALSVVEQGRTALNLASGHNITLPASPKMALPYNYTFQGWFKKPASWGTYNALVGGQDSYWRYDASQTMIMRAAGHERGFPYKFNWNSEEFMFLTLVKEGNKAHLFLNGDRLLIGCPTVETEQWKWSNESTNIKIGITWAGYYFNGMVDDFEIYAYPLSPLQIKYSYNGGSNRIFDPAFYNYNSIEGMAIIADIGAVNETAMLNLKPSEGYFNNLTGANTINIDCYSLRAGNNFALALLSGTGVEFNLPITISTAKTWETVTLDISEIQDNVKREITKIGVRITNADEVNIISIKNIVKA